MTVSVQELVFEIGTQIFLYCLSEGAVKAPTLGVSIPTSSTHRVPLALSSVCRKWREIALATPELWTTFCISVSPQSDSSSTTPGAKHSPDPTFGPTGGGLSSRRALKKFLERSGNKKLNISLDLWGNTVALKAFLTLVLGVKDRWGNVRIFSPAGTLDSLMGSLTTTELGTSQGRVLSGETAPSPGPVVGLESLILSSVAKPESFWSDHGIEYTISLSAYPALRSFGFSWPGTFAFSVETLPATLQRLDLDYYMPVEDLRRIVSHLPNLVSLRVHFDRNAWREEREEWAWKGAAWSITMNKLEELDLRTSPGTTEEHFLKFLDRLTLPVLSNFKLQYTSFPSPPLENIRKLFERSFHEASSPGEGTPLKRMTLFSYDRYALDQQLVKIFELTPSLEYLQIQNTDLSETVLRALELYHDDCSDSDSDSENEEGPIGLFPNLRQLHWTSSLSGSRDAYGRMISSRVRGRSESFLKGFVCDMLGTFNVQTSDLVGNFTEVQKAVDLGAKIDVAFY